MEFAYPTPKKYGSAASATKPAKYLARPAVTNVDSDAEIDYHVYIRDKVRQQVNDCLWLSDLKEMYNKIKDKLKEPNSSMSKLERCVVCSLLCGTCEHTANWHEENSKPKVDLSSIQEKASPVRRKLKAEAEIEEALGVLGKHVH